MTAAQSRKPRGPYRGTILDAMDAAGMTGPDWDPVRSLNRVIYGQPLNDDDRERYRKHTGRTMPPCGPYRTAYVIAGRRGHKTSNGSLVAFHRAISFDSANLAPGESGVVLFLASDRTQAAIGLRYTKALCTLPEFKPFVHRILKDTIELHSGIRLVIGTSTYAAVRGYTVICAVCDELAFWSVSSESVNPDTEVLRAIKPGMTTVPNRLLLCISSPYAARGELHAAYERSYGQNASHELVWVSDTASMNPAVPQDEIDAEFARDPVAAMSEFGRDGTVVFRSDVQEFLSAAAVLAVTASERRELPPIEGTRYVAFCDAASGGGTDSFTLGIAHRVDRDHAVLDLLRERRPRFDPDAVVCAFSDVLASYGITEVVGDRFAAGWVAERFRAYGIKYVPSERSKSQIYIDSVAPINSGRVALLDHQGLRTQLLNLERRTARAGRDTVDHRVGGHDDLSNAALGALLLALPDVSKKPRRVMREVNGMFLWVREDLSPRVPRKPAGPAPEFGPNTERVYHPEYETRGN